MLRPLGLCDQSKALWKAGTVLLGSLLLTVLLALFMRKKLLYTIEIEQRIKKQFKTNQEMERQISESMQMERALKKERDRAQLYLDVSGYRPKKAN